MYLIRLSLKFVKWSKTQKCASKHTHKKKTGRSQLPIPNICSLDVTFYLISAVHKLQQKGVVL